MLAEEERERHKLDRKLVAEAEWLRYSITRAASAMSAASRPFGRCARRGASTKARPARS